MMVADSSPTVMAGIGAWVIRTLLKESLAERCAGKRPKTRWLRAVPRDGFLWNRAVGRIGRGSGRSQRPRFVGVPGGLSGI